MPRIKEYYILYKISEIGYNIIAEVFSNTIKKEQFEFIKVGYKFK